MKKFKWFTLFFVSLLVFFGCNSGGVGKEELKKTYYKNGKIHEIIPYLNGVAHGIKKEYYDNGALRLEVPYDSGFVRGNVKYYHTNGKLYSLTPRINGKIHGIVKKYYSSGELQSETPYTNDELQTGLKEYDKKGNLIENPALVFKTKRIKRSKDLQVTVEISLSKPAKNVKFSQAIQHGEQDETFSTIPSTDGVGQLSVILTPGSSIDQEILVRAEFITPLKNRCVIHDRYRFFARN